MPMLEAKTSTAANGNANNVTIGIVAYGANRARARRRGRRAANCGRRRCSAGAKAPRWELARLWWALHLQLAQPAWACQQVRAQPATERTAAVAKELFRAVRLAASSGAQTRSPRAILTRACIYLSCIAFLVCTLPSY